MRFLISPLFVLTGSWDSVWAANEMDVWQQRLFSLHFGEWCGGHLISIGFSSASLWQLTTIGYGDFYPTLVGSKVLLSSLKTVIIFWEFKSQIRFSSCFTLGSAARCSLRRWAIFLPVSVIISRFAFLICFFLCSFLLSFPRCPPKGPRNSARNAAVLTQSSIV